MLAIAKNTPSPDIISQKRKEQSIFAIAFEAVELRHKVSAEQRVRLPFGHIWRKMLPLLELMPIAHIRITALSVKSLKEFHTHHSTLKRRKSVQRTHLCAIEGKAPKHSRQSANILFSHLSFSPPLSSYLLKSKVSCCTSPKLSSIYTLIVCRSDDCEV